VLFVASFGFLFAKDTPISAQEYYNFLQKNLQEQNWKNVLSYCQQLRIQYPMSPFTSEVSYYEGLAYYSLGNLLKANELFSKYLENETNPKFFEEVMQKKFLIAERFRSGEKKPVFGLKLMPRLQSAYDEAIKIYDELIHSLPNDDLAKKSLYAKSMILFEETEYKDSIESFQKLIHHFPKSDLAIESYVQISKIYLAQCSPKNQDLNLLGLAEVNIKHFEESFPQEKRVEEAKTSLKMMHEIYAKGLYEIGKFFERTNKSQAAIIYYSKIIDNFPLASYAQLSKERLQDLKK
jgi:outer membrane protein assembly factor BamD (BamD/ComL family)